jgi:hypothetical protein
MRDWRWLLGKMALVQFCVWCLVIHFYPDIVRFVRESIPREWLPDPSTMSVGGQACIHSAITEDGFCSQNGEAITASSRKRGLRS